MAAMELTVILETASKRIPNIHGNKGRIIMTMTTTVRIGKLSLSITAKLLIRPIHICLDMTLLHTRLQAPKLFATTAPLTTMRSTTCLEHTRHKSHILLGRLTQIYQ